MTDYETKKLDLQAQVQVAVADYQHARWVNSIKKREHRRMVEASTLVHREWTKLSNRMDDKLRLFQEAVDELIDWENAPREEK